MALKFKFNSRQEIPADLTNHYVERDGAFLLDLEGGVEKARLDEMRANNLELRKQFEDLTKRFEGIDPEVARGLAAEKRKLEEAHALKNGEVEKLIASRVQAAKTELEKQLATLSAERDSLNTRLADIQINQGVVLAATKRGLRASAIPDATLRAHNVFKLEGGLPRAFEADGKTARMGRDGVSPMTLDEWVDGLVAEAPHLFESNAGGGAVGGGSGGVVTTENPWKKESFNLTKQGQVFRQDPARARSLMATAGVK